MGNRPSGARGGKGNTNGTITAVLEDGRGSKGQGGGDRAGSGTQGPPLHKGNSTEMNSSATGSSVTDVPMRSLRPSSCVHGNPFAPMMFCNLEDHPLYFELITSRLVRLPESEWKDVSKCHHTRGVHCNVGTITHTTLACLHSTHSNPTSATFPDSSQLTLSLQLFKSQTLHTLKNVATTNGNHKVCALSCPCTCSVIVHRVCVQHPGQR